MSAQASIEQRLRAMGQRLRALEDEAEIRRLIASYGPRADSGDAQGTAGLWEADGVYDVDELVMEGQSAIAAMVSSPHHQGWIASGCAHVLSPAHVLIDGDDAVAVCHSLMLVNEEGRFVVRRATANHWTLRRGEAGWRVLRRTSRILDGRPEAPALFRSRGSAAE
jgi:uncharacterized protein (TIGR02246 family)